jgi:hypothetical protein
MGRDEAIPSIIEGPMALRKTDLIGKLAERSGAIPLIRRMMRHVQHHERDPSKRTRGAHTASTRSRNNQNGEAAEAERVSCQQLRRDIDTVNARNAWSAFLGFALFRVQGGRRGGAASWAHRLGASMRLLEARGQSLRAGGCARCRGTGFRCDSAPHSHGDHPSVPREARGHSQPSHSGSADGSRRSS